MSSSWSRWERSIRGLVLRGVLGAKAPGCGAMGMYTDTLMVLKKRCYSSGIGVQTVEQSIP
jgi:hypothetical protein